MKAFRQIQHIGSRKWIQTFATSKLRAKPNLIFPFCPTLSPFISFTPLQLPLSSMPSFSQFNKHQFISQTTGGASIRCFSSRSVPTSNHYDTLGLPHNSNVSKEQIKRAYFERAKETHPDLNPDDPYAKKNFEKYHMHIKSYLIHHQNYIMIRWEQILNKVLKEMEEAEHKKVIKILKLRGKKYG